MNLRELLEHKKGVKAKKYNKKPKAYITPTKLSVDKDRDRVDESANNEPQLMTAFRKFLPVAMSGLKLNKLPKIKLEKIISDNEQPTFGMYDDSKQIIYLAVKNRHTLDILRTLAHELIHFKQNEDQRLKDDSGATGSKIENEANAQAAVIMRHFNKKYPEFFQDADTEIDEARKRKRKRKSTGAAYGPGLYGGYGYYAGYSGDSSGGDGGGESIRYEHNINNSVIEAAYAGNIGAMEMFKFYSKATDDQKLLLKKLISAGEDRRAWQLIQKISGVKLVGKEFNENFADGKNPQDKGDSKRHGINTKASVSSLRKTAKQGGRKGQLAHWLANMKSGRKK